MDQDQQKAGQPRGFGSRQRAIRSTRRLRYRLTSLDKRRSPRLRRSHSANQRFVCRTTSTSQELTTPAAREDEEEAEANKRRRARRDQHERHKREQRNGDVDPRERSDRDRGERSERRYRQRDRGAASDSDSDSTDDHVEDKPKMLEAPKSRKSALEEPLMSGGLGEAKQDPLGLTNMGNLRENPDVPGQYTGYVRNPPMPQAATVKKASF
jgi:hypothetical protein